MNTVTRIVLFTAAFMCASLSNAQPWTLQRCIDYAIANNIQVQQVELQCESQSIAVNSAKMAYLPDLNASVSQNFSFGRATGNDNVIINNSMASTGLNAFASVPLFTGMRNLNQIKSSKLNLSAYINDLAKAKEDISLNVVAYYLQVMYADALRVIATEQVTLSAQQIERTKVLVSNGKISESELYEAMAQHASDKQGLTEANNTYQLAKLDLCQLLNYQDIEGFDLASMSPTESMPADYTLAASPQQAYNYSLQNRPAILAAQNRMESSKKEIKIAQADYYPQLSLSASYGTG